MALHRIQLGDGLSFLGIAIRLMGQPTCLNNKCHSVSHKRKILVGCDWVI